MTCFADLLQALKAQVEQAVDEMAQPMAWLEREGRRSRPTPLNSMLTQGCLATGRGVTEGGALYDLTAVQGVGLATTADSLHAIERLVFEQQRFSLEEFVAIMKADFEGHEALRVELRRRMPRYGCGHPRADAMASLTAELFCDTIRRRENTRGGRWIPGFYSMTCGTSFGRLTGASADGRRAGERLSNGFSPVDGADVQGPSALLRSAASLDSTPWANGGALNLKFDALTARGPLGHRALSSLLRTYLVDQGGMQVQVNVLDTDLLRAARADPDSHPHLLVRVSGYCAYFTDLQPEVQDEIIDRVSHGLG